MGEDAFGPCQGLSSAEGARVLGMRANDVDRLVSRGVLLKAVRGNGTAWTWPTWNPLALQRYIPDQRWFVTNREAAQILGVSRSRVNQLVNAGRLPFVEYRGRRYFRRQQIQVIANARNARWHNAANQTGT